MASARQTLAIWSKTVSMGFESPTMFSGRYRSFRASRSRSFSARNESRSSAARCLRRTACAIIEATVDMSMETWLSSEWGVDGKSPAIAPTISPLSWMGMTSSEQRSGCEQTPSSG